MIDASIIKRELMSALPSDTTIDVKNILDSLLTGISKQLENISVQCDITHFNSDVETCDDQHLSAFGELYGIYQRKKHGLIALFKVTYDKGRLASTDIKELREIFVDSEFTFKFQLFKFLLMKPSTTFKILNVYKQYSSLGENTVYFLAESLDFPSGDLNLIDTGVVSWIRMPYIEYPSDDNNINISNYYVWKPLVYYNMERNPEIEHPTNKNKQFVVDMLGLLSLPSDDESGEKYRSRLHYAIRGRRLGSIAYLEQVIRRASTCDICIFICIPKNNIIYVFVGNSEKTLNIVTPIELVKIYMEIDRVDILAIGTQIYVLPMLSTYYSIQFNIDTFYNSVRFGTGLPKEYLEKMYNIIRQTIIDYCKNIIYDKTQHHNNVWSFSKSYKKIYDEMQHFYVTGSILAQMINSAIINNIPQYASYSKYFVRNINVITCSYSGSDLEAASMLNSIDDIQHDNIKYNITCTPSICIYAADIDEKINLIEKVPTQRQVEIPYNTFMSNDINISIDKKIKNRVNDLKQYGFVVKEQ